MRRIAVINQKGGVGKTTTTVNLGAALAHAGKRVLLIDLDPQSHLTLHLGTDPATRPGGTYEALTQSTPLDLVRKQVSRNLWMVGSHIDLAAAEVELVSVVGREVILRDLLDAHKADYDYILMDCPPSLGVLTLNALSAASEIFIPLQPHYLALHGLSKLLETVSLVARRINPPLRVTGVAVCMHEPGTRLASEVLEDVRAFLDASQRGQAPWAGARVFKTLIRRNIKLAECPSHGMTIFDYAPKSNGAEDYASLAIEVRAMVEPDLALPVAVPVQASPETAAPAPPVPAASSSPASVGKAAKPTKTAVHAVPTAAATTTVAAPANGTGRKAAKPDRRTDGQATADAVKSKATPTVPAAKKTTPKPPQRKAASITATPPAQADVAGTPTEKAATPATPSAASSGPRPSVARVAAEGKPAIKSAKTASVSTPPTRKPSSPARPRREAKAEAAPVPAPIAKIEPVTAPPAEPLSQTA